MYEFTGNLKYKKAFELSQFESHMRFSVERCHALRSSRGVTSALCSPEVGGGGGAAGGVQRRSLPLLSFSIWFPSGACWPVFSKDATSLVPFSLLPAFFFIKRNSCVSLTEAKITI